MKTSWKQGRTDAKFLGRVKKHAAVRQEGEAAREPSGASGGRQGFEGRSMRGEKVGSRDWRETREKNQKREIRIRQCDFYQGGGRRLHHVRKFT